LGISDPQFKPNAMTLQDVKVDLYQNAAIVTGTYRAKGSYNGKPYDHEGRFTDAWMFEKGRWQCVASHSSLIKK
jgi:ketosteroid isomerase-like protein